MNQSLQKNYSKNLQNSVNDNDISFRTLKAYPYYNLNDFLPPSQPTHSRSMMINTKTRQTVATQASQKQIKSYEFSQLKCRVSLLQQQRTQIKNNLQKANLIIQQKDQIIANLKQLLKQQDKDIQQLKIKMQIKPKLSLSSNCAHFQFYPKFKQTYQITVQTDPIIETVISNTVSSVKHETLNKISSDRQIQNIYEKLQNLKMGKRTNKAQQIRPTSQLINPKTERPRLPALSTVWGTWQDKENMIRLSNEPDFLTKLNQNTFQTNRQRIRHESIDIYAIEEDKLQRILNAYLD